MRNMLILLAFSCFLIIGCDKGTNEAGQGEKSAEKTAPQSSLSVSVFGVTSPVAVKFEGHCDYIRSGKEKRLEIKGEGNICEVFRGESFKRCEVRKTSDDDGWIQLLVSVDGKTVFESEEVVAKDLIVYEADQ